MNATTVATYCEVHPGMDAKVRYPDGSDGCYWCAITRPRAEKREPVVEHGVPAYKRPNACVDCGASILAKSVRCKDCGAKYVWVIRRERYGHSGAPR